MKIHIPAFEPMAKCNEHLRHGAIDIDLGENIIEVIRCRDCRWFNEPGCAIRIVDDSDKPTENDYCSFAERKEKE